MHLTLAQMAVTAVLIALLPLSLVWTSSDVNKYRKLVWVCVFITFDLIVFGAFTRLTDSGLGCPDWPGCYGAANPFLAHEQITAAETLLPTGPVTVLKAWIEMIHRYLAMTIGLLTMALMAQAWYRWLKTRRTEYAPALPTAAFLCVCVQGAFGAWTVTLKLQPVIVTIHLLLGMSLLALLAWFGGRQNQLIAPTRTVTASPPAMRNIRLLAAASAVLLLAQLALGGWTSTNYATLACTDFPLCGGKLVPDMDFEHGFTLWRELGKTAAGHYLPFSALTAIHWVHRNFGLLVALVAGYTAWRAWEHAALHKTARYLALTLGAQIATGIATIYLSFPLAIAVLHNAGAALLVLLLTMLNYKAKYQYDLAKKAVSGAASLHTTHR
ncbi:heme A synthase [Duganella sp. BJB488]|uniref:COX15/CtaA family protein n=1 Tax=unclassified Duganella TaxID=2636909 RepID=UPI000E35650B|nr:MULTISPECIES: COX15/CtaA family protein [unclassified Duganella]RFP22879.1 heme A synthase [Duganella sp. BJB489]RFP25045.1 heme A synthase [Duganella sp. BJB488]RFP33878.1 heme A synthase [Duganella sp. BJB480]